MILLARDATSKASNYKVLLVKRASTLRFMAGFHVFPGGVVDKEDSSVAAASIRELFEETGIALDERMDGAASVGLGQQYGNVLHWARWLTPPQLANRFDTTFFVSVLPREPAHLRLHAAECEEAGWFTPRDALAQQATKAIKLAPPTWILLNELASLPAADTVLAIAAARTRDAAQSDAVVPQLVPRDGGGEALLLPGDWQHQAAETAAAAVAASTEDPSSRSRTVFTADSHRNGVMKRRLVIGGDGSYEWIHSLGLSEPLNARDCAEEQGKQ
jgi:8-oxo-dGTP pyrophosphatase MutT (NUDIX family)